MTRELPPIHSGVLDSDQACGTWVRMPGLPKRISLLLVVKQSLCSKHGWDSVPPRGEAMTEIEINVVDVGARYGIHPSWSVPSGLASFFLLEPDPAEANWLRDFYRHDADVSVLELAASNRIGRTNLNIRRFGALSSVDGLGQFVLEGYRHHDFESEAEVEVGLTTLDDHFSDRAVHFLKLDVEGHELAVLEGSELILRDSVLGVRSEVSFVDVFSSGANFASVHDILTENGFFLLNLDYDGRGLASNCFGAGTAYGRLVSTDGVWLKDLDRQGARVCDADVQNDLLRQALFCLLNRAPDLAIDRLQLWSQNSKTSPHDGRGSLLFAFLKLEIAKQTRSMLDSPLAPVVQVHEVWESIFLHPFPVGEHYWRMLHELGRSLQWTARQ